VIGAGAREHALCWRLAASATVEEVVCAPGNVGIAEVARLRPVDPVNPAAVTALALEEGVDLTVIGPEAPLAAGVVDAVAAAGLPVFGPTAAAARLETSKSFAKDVMAYAGVATAEWWAGDDVDQALAALDRFGAPYVVKADGLAAGKGVIVTEERAQAEAAVRAALVEAAFGEAGRTILVEAFLDGPEVSAFALSDGTDVRMLAQARDYKRVGDGDAGPNTGGMGAFSPVYLGGGVGQEGLRETVFEPVVARLAELGAPYRGVLYAGMILTTEGPRVLEFNARFGDPEAEVLMPRLRTDLGALLAACAHGELGALGDLEWDRRAAVAVVLASGGYPGDYRTGLPISGLEELAGVPDVAVFHAGTRREGDRVVTAGGRVLAVSALGEDVDAARKTAYAAADKVSFEGLYRREDIASEASWPA
jgi:phosphoribosylamine--glycine ligase